MVLCQDSVVKGITTILYMSNPAVKLLLGSGKLLLSIIILNMIPEYVFHELNDIRSSAKSNPTRRATTMVMLSQEVRYTNPEKNIIQPCISKSTVLLQDSVCAILVDLDAVFRRFLLSIMQLGKTYWYVVLVHYL